MQRLEQRTAALEASQSQAVDQYSTDANLLEAVGWRMARAPTDAELQALADNLGGDHAQDH